MKIETKYNIGDLIQVELKGNLFHSFKEPKVCVADVTKIIIDHSITYDCRFYWKDQLLGQQCNNHEIDEGKVIGLVEFSKSNIKDVEDARLNKYPKCHKNFMF